MMSRRALADTTVYLIFFLLCFIPTNIFFIDGIDSLVLMVVTPLLLFYSLKRYSNYLKNKEISLYLCWFIWLVITCITAVRPSASFQLLKTISGGVMLSLIYYMLAHEKKLIPYLYTGYIVILLAEIYYANTTFVGEALGTDIRANDVKLNANGLAYMTFYSLCSIYVLGELEIDKRLSTIVRVGFFFMIFVTVYVALITASRQVLPIALSAWLLLFFRRYVKNMNAPRALLIVLLVIVGYYLYSHVFESLYSDSLLATRTERTDNTDTRYLVIVEALEICSNNLLVGVGPGNFVHLSRYGIFTHNSYAEILVSCGVLGLILYLLIIINFLKNQIKRYRRTKDALFYSFFLIGLIWAIYNILYVFYVGVYLIPFLFLLMGHSDCLYREKYSKQISVR